MKRVNKIAVEILANRGMSVLLFFMLFVNDLNSQQIDSNGVMIVDSIVTNFYNELSEIKLGSCRRYYLISDTVFFSSHKKVSNKLSIVDSTVNRKRNCCYVTLHGITSKENDGKVELILSFETLRKVKKKTDALQGYTDFFVYLENKVLLSIVYKGGLYERVLYSL
ncbi:hypothetical protein KFE94_16800 [bacterium SCSIO 12643]|nr:hypothetical protein KFE94_16800 [bacterium SCSIO 12643]